MAEMSTIDVESLRRELGIKEVEGVDCPPPITKWSQLGLPYPFPEVLQLLNYTSPTPIQAQAIPALMSGRDVTGVSPSISGKKVAFLVPMFQHIIKQRPLEKMEGPIALVIVPTSRSVERIYHTCKPFLEASGLRAACSYGGAPKAEARRALARGSEVLICTPDRLLDLLTSESGSVTNLKRVTCVVIAEADLMLNIGLEHWVMKIVDGVQPERQIVILSVGTFTRQVDSLAKKMLRNPLKITAEGRIIDIDDTVDEVSEDSDYSGV